MKLVSARARAAQLAAQAPRNILCLTVDRLNADFLGAYGNTWIETPAFDALAAESVLFDSFYGTSLDLSTLFRAFWRGESPREIVDELREDDDPAAPGSLFRALKEQRDDLDRIAEAHVVHKARAEPARRQPRKPLVALQLVRDIADKVVMPKRNFSCIRTFSSAFFSICRTRSRDIPNNSAVSLNVCVTPYPVLLSPISSLPFSDNFHNPQKQ